MYLLAGIPHLTTLIAPPVSGLLMLIRIWLPFAVAIGALNLGLLIIVFMPESLGHHSSAPKSPLLGAADTLTRTDSGEGTVTPSEQLPRGIHDRMPGPDPEHKEWWRDVIVLIQMPGLPFCYLLFFLKPLAMISKAFVYQYASYNFHWGLSQTTWLRFSQAGGSSLATVVVLPLLSSVLHRRGPSAQMLDLNVIRGSLLVAMTGFVLLQLSYHSWMLLLGRRRLPRAIVLLRMANCIISALRMRHERRRRACAAGPRYFPHRSQVPCQTVHFGRRGGDPRKARRRPHDGQVVFHRPC